jgi:MFS family permease
LALGIVLLFFNVLNDELGILKLIIIISAFISLAAVVPIFFLSDPKEAKFVDERRISLIQNLKTLPKAYYKFLFVSLLFGLANFTVLLFIFHTKMVVLGIDENSSPLFQIIITIGVFIWFNIIYTILSTPFGSWSDKHGRKVIFSIGLVLFIITCFGFIIVNSFILLILFFGLYGAFMAATDGIQKACVVDLLPSHLKGTGIGLLQTLVGFAGIIGGLIAGFLYEFDFILTFIYGGTIALISLVILLITNFTPQETLNS